MLDNIFKRDDVLTLIDNIRSNDKYYLKESEDKDKFYYNDEALFILFDAIYKYSIIIEDIFFLDEFIYDLDLLFRKIDDFNNIKLGINKLIIKLSKKKLGLEEINREEIITFIYDRYINHGYFIHGYSNVYKDSIIELGFNPEEYNNYYNDFNTIKNLFEKYKKEDIINKEFSKKISYFTDDFIDSIIYSLNGPLYFSELISKDKDNYYLDNYELCVKNITNIMNNLSFSNVDKEYVLSVIKKEWDLLHRKDKCISLLLVKRKLFSEEHIDLDEIIKSDLDINDCIDRILCPKHKNVTLTKKIESKDILFIDLDVYRKKEEKEEEIFEEKYEEEKDKFINEELLDEFNNTYGKVTPLLLIGSLLICLGVIITIISVIGGI